VRFFQIKVKAARIYTDSIYQMKFFIQEFLKFLRKLNPNKNSLKTTIFIKIIKTDLFSNRKYFQLIKL